MKYEFKKVLLLIFSIIFVISCAKTKQKDSGDNLASNDILAGDNRNRDIASFSIDESNDLNHYNCDQSLNFDLKTGSDDLYCLDHSSQETSLTLSANESNSDTLYVKSNFNKDYLYVYPGTQQGSSKNIIHFAHLGDLSIIEVLTIDNSMDYFIFEYENGKRLYIQDAQNAHFKVNDSSLYSSETFKSQLISQCQLFEEYEGEIASKPMLTQKYSCI